MGFRLKFVLIALICGLIAPTAGPAVAQTRQHNPLLLDIPKDPVKALDFSGETLSGKQLRLSDFKGKVVMLNFWATWCVPCLLEMPAMDRLNRKLAGQPFKMLAVNLGEPVEQIRKFADQYNFSYDLVLDPIGQISTAYGANRLPVSYLIDKKGYVIRRAIGPREWDSADAMELFRKLMEAQ